MSLQFAATASKIVGPAVGSMACGETGPGRMVEPDDLTAVILDRLALPSKSGPIVGKRAVVTAGPTYEPLDPVRFLGNRSSGKQGRAIAASLSEAGATVTLVAGPGAGAALGHCDIRQVESAVEMREAVLGSLPADIFVATAAVADWRPAEVRSTKIKKVAGGIPDWNLELVPNPGYLGRDRRDWRRTRAPNW